jgi:DegV family protein with EDD domain
MAKIKVVTDGSADIPPELARELGIEVAPLVAHLDEKIYRLGIDISDEQLYELLGSGHPRFRVSSPSSSVIEQLYRGLIGDVDHIFSIHLGTRLGAIHANAAQARARLPASTTRVELIDGKSASMGLGSVVLAAAQAARDGASPDEISRLIHATIRHTHVVFFVDSMEYLESSGRLTIAGSVLGSMQRIKPLMILDEGEIVPYERTRTRAKAIEGPRPGGDGALRHHPRGCREAAREGRPDLPPRASADRPLRPRHRRPSRLGRNGRGGVRGA